MNTITITAKPIYGMVSVNVYEAKNQFIGLLELNLKSSDVPSIIDITCDEIDSTLNNPSRLLRRVYANATKKHYSTFRYDQIIYQKLDAESRYLYLHFSTADGKPITEQLTFVLDFK